MEKKIRKAKIIIAIIESMMAISFIIIIIMGLLVRKSKIFEVLYALSMCAMIISTIIFFLYIKKLGKNKIYDNLFMPKAVKAEIKRITVYNYDDLEFRIKEYAKEIKYGMIYNKENIMIFAKNSLLRTTYFAITNIINVDEKSIREFEKKAHNIINKFSDKNYYYVNESRNFVPVICTMYENKDFNEYVNESLMQLQANIRVPVGILFSNYNMYIATQVDCMGKGIYKKTKKEILKFFDQIIYKDK